MNASILTPNERKRILAQLDELYGVSKLNGLLIQTNKERIRFFSGSMNREELLELDSLTHVEIVGLYLARPEYGLRLSFDASHLLGKTISKSVLELSQEESREWMKGNGLQTAFPKGIYVIKSGEDFFGCGYSDGQKLWNFVPKERRVRK